MYPQYISQQRQREPNTSFGGENTDGGMDIVLSEGAELQPIAYGNALTAYLDLNPMVKACVYYGGAIAAAITLVSWLSPSSGKPKAAGDDSPSGNIKRRRRGAECALAILPDGSKDRSDREWKRVLPPDRFASLRKSETDEPNLEADDGGIDDVLELDGRYHCAGCDTPLYDSDHRFEAGCGWPCFYTCLPDAVRERRDKDDERMELICNACNGHVGHIFRGEAWSLPPPAERHCLNARSLVFIRDAAESERLRACENDDDDDDEVDERINEWESAETKRET